ncbi:MAG TPA: PAS domain-containing protein [Lamprocystis sp. (in: g-proteobacteria)]|nr:PAS domain-containing protein [Lamprocystis sp. (in: g-proteobacteria)]
MVHPKGRLIFHNSMTLKDTDNRRLADRLADLRRETLDLADPGTVVLNLQDRQIELEMQNRELRATQQALDKSRDRYANLYDFAPVANATLNRLGQITQMNLTAAQLLGVERGLALNLLLTTRLLAGDGRALLASLARVLTEGEAESIKVTRGQRPPRQRCNLRLLIRREGPQCSGAAPTACRVILLDITTTRKAQAVIVTQQHFLQSVVDGIADPIRVTDKKHRVRVANAAAQADGVDGSVGPLRPVDARPDIDGEAPGAASPVPEVPASNAAGGVMVWSVKIGQQIKRYHTGTIWAPTAS